MKNFMYGILAGLILFVGYNNKTAVANFSFNILKGTGQAISNAFTPKVAQSEEMVQQQVAERKTIKRVTQQVSKISQKVASKVINVAQAAEVQYAPPAPKAQPAKQPQYIASTNNNYMTAQKPVSAKVSQYKANKRQNSRTSISLITE